MKNVHTIALSNNTNSISNSNEYSLIGGDSIEVMKDVQTNSIDLVFADPPYFLSNDGVTCKSGKMVSVNKGKWDTKDSYAEINHFNELWLTECQRVLSKDGSIWISGTNHNIFSIGHSLRLLDFRIINTITWQKPNPPPNLGCRCFTHSTETIIWASKSKKSKHCFDYKLMKQINGGKQMKDVWTIKAPNKSEKEEGKHPTQKPVELLERIILASSEKGDIVLDPFCGSGTTGVAAVLNHRKFIGIDVSVEYLEIARRRISKITPLMF